MLPSRRLRLALVLLLGPLGLFATPDAPPENTPPGPPAATPPNPLARWRENLPALDAAIATYDGHLISHENPHDPLPDFPASLRAAVSPLLPLFRIEPGEVLAFDRIHGPETPFPDHQPLRQLVSLRTVLARQSLAAGDTATALSLVRENLAAARATLLAQEGIIPLIHATSVWQSALDGVHALALSPTLSPDSARALLRELQADDRLASLAITRALRGEFDYVYRVIVERMPATDDPDLFLSSVSSLGMAPPEPLQPGELGLGLTPGHVLLDVPATLAAYEADLAPYLAALARDSRLPREIYPATTARTLDAFRRELGRFLIYASGELPPSLAETTLARADLLAATNPGGKLLAVYLTPPWPVLLSSALRRETQRSALCGLLAWRIHGGPTTWEILIAKDILPAAPADPFSNAPLPYALGPLPRIWSVYLDARDDGGDPAAGNFGQPDDLVWRATAD
ncbi:MAG: hypothetical protein H7067_18970 [Burkholderiales bacterium]|nr:hypothetical protein [Opitutaceae bacterium]